MLWAHELQVRGKNSLSFADSDPTDRALSLKSVFWSVARKGKMATSNEKL